MSGRWEEDNSELARQVKLLSRRTVPSGSDTSSSFIWLDRANRIVFINDQAEDSAQIPWSRWAKAVTGYKASKLLINSSMYFWANAVTTQASGIISIEYPMVSEYAYNKRKGGSSPTNDISFANNRTGHSIYCPAGGATEGKFESKWQGWVDSDGAGHLYYLLTGEKYAAWNSASYAYLSPAPANSPAMSHITFRVEVLAYQPTGG